MNRCIPFLLTQRRNNRTDIRAVNTLDKNPSTPPQTPGERIKQKRLEQGLYIVELAENTGITKEAISNIERGVLKQPKLDTLKKLSEALDTTIGYLGCFEMLPEETIGQKICKARMYHGLTKQEIANRLGVDTKTLLNWERGLTQPLPLYMTKINEILKILE